MPFTAAEISEAGKIGLDYYIKKKKPTDQVAVERPWLRALMRRKMTFPGAKQNVVEQLRYRYQNNFQWFNGRKVVTYNVRNTVEQANFPWRGCHDGFSLDEDRLEQNGIKVTDDSVARHTRSEEIRLTDLLNENIDVLRLGWEEQFDQYLLRDGTGSTDDIVGLDALVSLTPTSGVVGGIDRSVAANSWWRNWAATGLTTSTTTGTILNQMEIYFRNCTRNGGKPNFIMAGSDFIDGYRNYLMKTYGTMNWEAGNTISLDGGAKMLAFKGVPMIWNPVFSDLDTLLSPGTPFEKRCYFINLNFMRLRPIEGQDMISRKPPRPYDRYEHYWGLTWRGALTMNRANCHAVLAIS